MSSSDTEIQPVPVNASALSASTPERCPICQAKETRHFLSAPDRFHLRTDQYDLQECRACESVWLSNPPRPEEMGSHYGEGYHQAIVQAGEDDTDLRWIKHRTQICRFKSGGAILDIGCSSGAFLGTMKSDQWYLFGIELQESTAARARSKTGATVFVGDALAAPFPPESFDVVTCFDLIEHVHVPVALLKQIRRWLKPNGILYIMIPNVDSWESSLFRSYWYGLELPRHLFHFSPRSLRRMLRAAGFHERLLKTSSVSYIERSSNYVWSRFIGRLGLSPTPQSVLKRSPLPWRAARKLMRLFLIAPFGWLASLCGAGASQVAVFKRVD